ncbi:WPP domain-interacting tail-anchored protein 2-like [Salvia hispanica]|uniref:WPP domain-interacting tail-anchored protein 2-like n=1 Tax=Salvia hispanica TaxID=49212 RepID=UPI0020099C27|nr:WPP domain-interacting tail-anchored protein 2-like [Salvia hispanica]XP_047973284.1 WPP domain-interacting tail-anchored protein 2-like [Salvia hispanica]
MSYRMVTNGMADLTSDIADPVVQKFLHKGLPNTPEDDGAFQNAMMVSSEVDTSLAYSSEKLANLENLLLRLLAAEVDIGDVNFRDDNISAEFVEKAFTFDLLYAILNFELRGLDHVMAGLQDLTVDALNKMSSSEHSAEVAGKLHGSENVLKRFQDRVLRIKIQLAKLQLTSFVFNKSEYKHDWDLGVKEELHLATAEWKPQMRIVEQRRVLRMLEISLAREVELEKKLMEVRQNEEDFKSKICLREQVAVAMEEAAEAAWGSFLEADNRAEVLMGISKEMMLKLQFFDPNVSSTNKREEELKLKLQDCVKQLNEKGALIQKLNSSNARHAADNAEVTALRERVQTLEGKLRQTESRLAEANLSSERIQQELKIRDDEIESVKETMYAAETRAESAEEKVSQLTDSNLELTEEVDFLKGSNGSNTKKISLLEKQLRDLDIQLQHARASSEASQEQQNMLYTAIWDMETLIDELKQKVTEAESKTMISEEQRVILSEVNSDLNKELDFRRSKLGFMEASLDKAALQKRSIAKDINIKSSVIMDMVMQLAVERERIHKQLASLMKENKLLRGTLRNQAKIAPLILQDEKSYDDRESLSSGLDSGNVEYAENSPDKATETTLENFEVEKANTSSSSLDESGAGLSSLADKSTSSVLDVEAESLVSEHRSRKVYLVMTTLVVLVPILAALLFHE